MTVTQDPHENVYCVYGNYFRAKITGVVDVYHAREGWIRLSSRETTAYGPSLESGLKLERPFERSGQYNSGYVTGALGTVRAAG